MKSKKLSKSASETTFVLVLDDGEEAFATITEFVRRENIASASLTAIGAFSRATVGWFDFASHSYRKIAIDQQCEVLSILGDVAEGDDDKPSVHIHAVLGLSDGTTRGGHFLDGIVHPTLEVILVETPVDLRRRKRADLGIALIDLSD
ncbi:DNA-binding protein [Labrys sp. LIt4]|uniref:PPC domain-containing DNA-binding protein n=1 Tax=Labrys sp. LIt4 TaxID=2821355 RepID=UPI001ADF2753|nr:PPC domain-containing DNA-binding protein [Labrys sp. LIt4]MBP0582768.1 DNA-binding protein [Labrys sp. LIt4]